MILITGGAGYIGSHTNKLMSKKGFETVVFDNLVNGHKEFAKWGEFIIGDLSDIEQIRAVFNKYKIDSVMHFAGFAYVGESVENPQKYYSNNVVNALNLLNVMKEYSVSKIVFSSTCATYGKPISLPIDENHRQQPINPYGRTKLVTEMILQDYCNAYNINYVILRYFNTAGADLAGEIGELHNPETHLIPIVLDVALGKRNHVKIYGADYETKDGTCIRDYIHVSDLAEAHMLALEYLSKNSKSEVFNLGNGLGYSVKEIISKVEEVTEKSIQTVEADRRPGDPPILIGSAKKAKDVLGWEPKLNLDIIIKSAWDWHCKAAAKL